MSYQPLWLRDLVAYSIQAAALVGVGVIMARALRLRMPRVRHAYWQALLALCVFLPLMQPWRPEILETPTLAMTNITLAAPEAVPAPTGPSLAAIVLWLICAGIVLRLAWMALGLGRLWHYRRHAERLNQTPEAVREAQRLAHASSSFFISRQVPTPATFGFFHPAILFPARFIEMEPEMQKAIALHELLHVERRDWLWNMFEEVVLTLLWFHLPLWWVVRSARLSREQVVDAEAIRRSNARRPYLKALLEMAGQGQLAESLPAPLFLRESQLAERVALMMKEVYMSRTRLTVSILTAAATLLIAGATLAWAFPLKISAPQPGTPAVASAPDSSEASNAAGAAMSGNTVASETEPVPKIGKVYTVRGKVKAPKAIYYPVPPYTEQARKAHLSGPVDLWAVIDTKGRVIAVKQSSEPLGHGLDESALNTVRTWKFKPAMREGVPVPVTVMVKIYFKFYDEKKSDPAVDPPAKGHANASIPTGVYAANLSQEEYQQQLDEATKQLKAAQMAAPTIDEKKLQQQIEQAMKQAHVAQEAASKIDQKKMQQQMEEAMKQLQKMNTPEMRQRFQEQMKQLEKLNSAEMQRHMQEQMKRLEKMNTPEMRRQMQAQMDQLKKMKTPEMRKQMEEAMKQLKMAQMAAPKIDEAQIRQQVEQAMQQVKVAQESAAKENKAELQRQLKQAREEVKQARKEVQEAREEARKAQQDAMKALQEVEEQRREGKPAPSAAPKPAPAPPKDITPPPAPPAPPAPPKKPESAAIVGGVPGGVAGGVPGGISGGVIATPQVPAPPSPAPEIAVPNVPALPSPAPKVAVPPAPPASPAPTPPPQN